jgi:hypothetical protein
MTILFLNEKKMLMAQSTENGGIFIYNSLVYITPAVTPHKYR